MYLYLSYVSGALLIVFLIGMIKGNIQSLRINGRGKNAIGAFIALCVLFLSVTSSPSDEPTLKRTPDIKQVNTADDEQNKNNEMKIKQDISAAETKLANNDFAGARADLKNALQIDPKSQAVSELLDKVNEKETEFTKEKSQADAINFLNSAKTKLEKHDYVGARADVKQSLSLNPGLVEAKDTAAQIDIEEKNFKEQQKQLDEVRYKADSKSIAFSELVKSSDSLKGSKVKLQGKIRDVQDGHNGSTAFLDVTYNDNKGWYNPVRISYYDLNAKVGDKITVWGEVAESFSNEIPSIDVKYMEKITQ